MYKFHLLIICVAFIATSLFGQDYFPPNNSDEWATTPLSELNWDPDKVEELYDFLDNTNGKAFILLIDGRIVLEKYFDDFTKDSLWYWASAGKTVTASLVGIAQDEGLLDINDKTSDYLGEGWTSLTTEQEDAITIWHQLTMTSGLNDIDVNKDCTDPACLTFLAEAGTRWSYHNAPYTLLENVVSNAAGMTYNQYYIAKLRNTIGMNGAWFKLDYNNVLFTNPRSMARFGLLIANNGYWDGQNIIKDKQYINNMVTKSQELNEAYGYLWWLNGYDTFMVPGIQLVFNGLLYPDAPVDSYAALGKNGQILNITPSKNMVWIRMGDAAQDEGAVAIEHCNEIWKYLNGIIDNPVSSVLDNQESSLELYPNPANDYININALGEIQIYNSYGELVLQFENQNDNFRMDISVLPVGLYYVRSEKKSSKFLIVR